MVARLVDLVAANAQQLPAGSRAWLSTEILESLFCRFKQLERQHSKGGFTGLLAGLPTLCRQVTAEVIRWRFKTTQAADVGRWIRETIPTTLSAQRNATYREAFANQ